MATAGRPQPYPYYTILALYSIYATKTVYSGPKRTAAYDVFDGFEQITRITKS